MDQKEGMKKCVYHRIDVSLLIPHLDMEEVFGGRRLMTFGGLTKALGARDAIMLGTGILPEQQARLFGCWCMRQVWSSLSQPMREAVEASEQYAQGEISEYAWSQALADAGLTSDISYAQPERVSVGPAPYVSVALDHAECYVIAEVRQLDLLLDLVP